MNEEVPPPIPMEGADVSVSGAPAPALPPLPAPKTTLCPYCGHHSENRKSCDRCRGLFEPLSRQATQNTMGPWFIRDEANPFRPGCSYQTLRMLVERGRVTSASVLRGPSTRQFWTLATRTPGVSHLLGVCYACQSTAQASESACAKCSATFRVVDDRQVLGLTEIRLIPGQASASQIAATIKHRGAPAEQPAPFAIELDPPAASAPLAPVAARLPLPNSPQPGRYDPAALDAQSPASATARESGSDPVDDDPWERAIRRTRSQRHDDDGAPGGMHRAMVISLLAFAGGGVLLVSVTFLSSLTAALNSRAATAAGTTTPAAAATGTSTATTTAPGAAPAPSKSP